MVYHLARDDTPATPICAEEFWREGDVTVTEAEAGTSSGRHFNCVHCHKVLTGGHRHMPPPSDAGEGWRA